MTELRDYQVEAVEKLVTSAPHVRRNGARLAADPYHQDWAVAQEALLTRLWREAMEKAGLQSVLLPNATKATVRDHRGHMDWPACWDEVLRFSIRQHWMQCVITS